MDLQDMWFQVKRSNFWYFHLFKHDCCSNMILIGIRFLHWQLWRSYIRSWEQTIISAITFSDYGEWRPQTKTVYDIYNCSMASSKYKILRPHWAGSVFVVCNKVLEAHWCDVKIFVRHVFPHSFLWSPFNHNHTVSLLLYMLCRTKLLIFYWYF